MPSAANYYTYLDFTKHSAGLEKIFWTYSSCGASGLNFSLVLTPVELFLKSGILKETKHIIQYLFTISVR